MGLRNKIGIGAVAVTAATMAFASQVGAEAPETATHALHGHNAVVKAASGAAGAQSLLASRGGSVMVDPHVYVVFWGSGWRSDPSGEKTYLTNFLKGVGGAADTWSTSTTQYCQGVGSGTTDCTTSATATYVTEPSNVYVDSWSDTGSKAPSRPTQSQLAAEASRAASHYAAVSGHLPITNVQFVVATAHGYSASGFGTQYCAWHSSTSTGYGTISYTNLPYIADAGGNCGANFVNAAGGSLDGVSIVEGHEYAEAVTDPYPNNGWLDPSGAENGDKCAWISGTDQGASRDVIFSTGTFPVQSLYSNNYSGGLGGCVTSYTDATKQS